MFFYLCSLLLSLCHSDRREARLPDGQESWYVVAIAMRRLPSQLFQASARCYLSLPLIAGAGPRHFWLDPKVPKRSRAFRRCPAQVQPTFVISTGCPSVPARADAWFSPPLVCPGKPAKALSHRTALLLMTNFTGPSDPARAGTAGKPGASRNGYAIRLVRYRKDYAGLLQLNRSLYR